MFRYYTQASCEFECKVIYSREKCGCSPWDYPQILHEDGSDVLCDGVNAFCFQEAMREQINCSCLPNCEMMQYETASYSIPINAKRECSTSNSIIVANCREANNSMFELNNDINILIAEKIRHTDGEELDFWIKRMQSELRIGTKSDFDSVPILHNLLDSGKKQYQGARLPVQLTFLLLQVNQGCFIFHI